MAVTMPLSGLLVPDTCRLSSGRTCCRAWQRHSGHNSYAVSTGAQALSKLLRKLAFLHSRNRALLYLTRVSYISMQVRESLQTRMAPVARYVEIFSGRVPSGREMAGIPARHKFRPHECAEQSGDGT